MLGPYAYRHEVAWPHADRTRTTAHVFVDNATEQVAAGSRCVRGLLTAALPSGPAAR